MRALRWIHRQLLRLARVIGRINTFVLLTFSFYLILLPLSMARRLFLREEKPAGWLPRVPLDRDHFKKQY